MNFCRWFSRLFFTISIIIAFTQTDFAQTSKHKYPSLLWEITGNGLKKPSYLFGTMHISSKLAFHLSDSFYTSIRNSDIVSLELNPEEWQNEIPRINGQSEEFQRFTAEYSDDYLAENSFTLPNFIPKIKLALSSEPGLNNALLYRNENGKDDFEEDTYLDLYIYQTGKKMGKKATGVETYIGSQKMALEAYLDATIEQVKNKNKERKSDNLNPYVIAQATQDAYRNGNLDQLDSIDKLTEESPAYTEKFLYKRNDMQAIAMDSIMQKGLSLFVGVGAAHLPGKRGVIEYLRKIGYTLRPIQMKDFDGGLKDKVDSQRVPINFKKQYAVDSFYSVSVPGNLHPLENNVLDQLNYADMANGSFYIITRIKTHPILNGYSAKKALKLIDSLLYEGVPGKIISKNNIVKNGYQGLDIINKTRRGDVQHYQIFATPIEIIMFKMGGRNNYVIGNEADQFFNSISLKENTYQKTTYSHPDAGFKIDFPNAPIYEFIKIGADNQPRLQLEAVDQNGNSFLLLRKDMYTRGFLEEDSFENALIMESFVKSNLFEKINYRKHTNFNGYNSLKIKSKSKDGAIILAQSFIQGPHEYLMAVRTKDETQDFSPFFHSITIGEPHYPKSAFLKDTFLKYAVTSPIKMQIDNDVLDLVNYSRKAGKIIADNNINYSGTNFHHFANYMCESTGEYILLDRTTYPTYYYAKDKKKYWDNEINLLISDSSMKLKNIIELKENEGISGYKITVADTNSSRLNYYLLLQKGMYLYSFFTTVDSNKPTSSFINDFFNTATITGVKPTPSIFDYKADLFFKDYNSTDTNTRKRAIDAISSIYFGIKGFPKITNAISTLHKFTPNYLDLKTKFINELGYLTDSVIKNKVVNTLNQYYQESKDTTILQNAVLQALSRLKTNQSINTFKKLLLQDPPVFESASDYSNLFSPIYDSLAMGKTLFPELLQLITIEDFKSPVLSLLADLKDSNYVTPSSYSSILSTLLFDSKIALKKQQNEAEQNLKEQENTETNYTSNNDYDTSLGMLFDYARLLIPFYNENLNIPAYFDKLLKSKNKELQLQTALSLYQNKQKVDPLLWNKFANDEMFTSRLYTVLKRNKLLKLFPIEKLNQTILANSQFKIEHKNAVSIKPLGKQLIYFKTQKGIVYFYKYKNKNSNWRVAIKGLEPIDEKYFINNSQFEDDIELNKNENINTQLDKLLHKSMIKNRDGGKNFYRFEDSNNGGYIE